MFQKQYPKISIVTPVFNQVDYIEATIQSVINQNYPNLEYIIVDGGSTDGTLEVIKKHESFIATVISEPDKGMYDALNKGFQLSSGDIMGWINGDDILLTGSLFNMARLFKDLPEVKWVQGLQTFIDLNENIINTCIPKKISFIKFLKGDFKWIQQESTFWRRSLWVEAGGRVDDSLKLAGDFELWFRFFQFTRLYYVNIPIGAWRKRDGQLSGNLMSEYLEEVSAVCDLYKKNEEEIIALKNIKRLERIIKLITLLKFFNAQYFVKKHHIWLNLEHIEIKYSYKKEKFIVL